MNKQELLNFALAQMHTGQWFGWKKDWTGEHRMSYENIIVLDNSITKPTLEEVEAKIEELKQAEQNAIAKKQSAIAKLSALGLTEEEIKALIGV